MFRRIDRVRSVVRFLRGRLPYYGPLVVADLHEFRGGIVKAAVGASIAAAAGLIFACFLSVAVLVTAWDAPQRTAVAWGICGGWGLLAAAGLWYARKAVSGPTPFRRMETALSRDYADLLATAERPET